MNTMRVIFAMLITQALVACGSYSEMQLADGSEPMLPVYQTAVVLDFDDATTLKTDDESRLTEHREALRVAGIHFADIIAAKLRTEGMYDTVLREQTDSEALVISGDITRYVEGDAFARFMIGLGAGSSYFDSIVRFSDNVTGDSLGEIKIDKNSWVLGGGIASTQTVEGYMKNSAAKIVEEINEARDAMRVVAEAAERQEAAR